MAYRTYTAEFICKQCGKPQVGTKNIDVEDLDFLNMRRKPVYDFECSNENCRASNAVEVDV